MKIENYMFLPILIYSHIVLVTIDYIDYCAKNNFWMIAFFNLLFAFCFTATFLLGLVLMYFFSKFVFLVVVISILISLVYYLK